MPSGQARECPPLRTRTLQRRLALTGAFSLSRSFRSEAGDAFSSSGRVQICACVCMFPVPLSRPVQASRTATICGPFQPGCKTRSPSPETQKRPDTVLRSGGQKGNSLHFGTLTLRKLDAANQLPLFPLGSLQSQPPTKAYLRNSGLPTQHGSCVDTQVIQNTRPVSAALRAVENTEAAETARVLDATTQPAVGQACPVALLAEAPVLSGAVQQFNCARMNSLLQHAHQAIVKGQHFTRGSCFLLPGTARSCAKRCSAKQRRWPPARTEVPEVPEQWHLLRRLQLRLCNSSRSLPSCTRGQSAAWPRPAGLTGHAACALPTILLVAY